MSDLEVTPVVEAVFEHRKAESSCCGAGLNVAGGESFTCRACGQPCDRVLAAPVEVRASWLTG